MPHMWSRCWVMTGYAIIAIFLENSEEQHTNACNINYKVPKFFPVIFHNLSGYDSHLFIKKLKGVVDNGEKIKCIPNQRRKVHFV